MNNIMQYSPDNIIIELVSTNNYLYNNTSSTMPIAGPEVDSFYGFVVRTVKDN